MTSSSSRSRRKTAAAAAALGMEETRPGSGSFFATATGCFPIIAIPVLPRIGVVEEEGRARRTKDNDICVGLRALACSARATGKREGKGRQRQRSGAGSAAAALLAGDEKRFWASAARCCLRQRRWMAAAGSTGPRLGGERGKYLAPWMRRPPCGRYSPNNTRSDGGRPCSALSSASRTFRLYRRVRSFPTHASSALRSYTSRRSSDF